MAAASGAMAGTAMSERTGRCLCGAVSFTASVPRQVTVCHCRQCRQWTGVAFYSSKVQPEDMTISGAENIVTHESSDWATRSFCKVCGSGLWYRPLRAVGEGHYSIGIGLLDDTSGLEIAEEIFIDEKPDCYALEGDHSRVTRAEIIAFYQDTV